MPQTTLLRRLLRMLLVGWGMLLPFTFYARNAAPWNELLAIDGLNQDAAQLPTPKLFASNMGRFPNPVFRQVWTDWRQLDPVSRRIGSDFLAASGNAAALVDVAWRLTAACPPEQPTPAWPEAAALPRSHELLVAAVKKIHAVTKSPLTDSQLHNLRQQVDRIPPSLTLQAAIMLWNIPTALDCRNHALANVGGPEKYPAMFDSALRLAMNYDVSGEAKALIEKNRLSKLLYGGMILAYTVDAARKIPVPEKEAKTMFAFRWDTPLGAIVINGAQDDNYPAGAYLLIVDSGGNDIYRGGGTTYNANNPVSLLFDESGDDIYESDGMAFGVGILGYGMLADNLGNDTYKATSGLAAASVGVGLLMDYSGNDSYSVRRYGEAAATSGLAILNDRQGNDRYYCFQNAQGLAQVNACAALVDALGNDRYEAETKKIEYPSPQSAQQNGSVAQGCGYGRRAHPGDGYSLSGGVGVLADGSGNDTYISGVFGQGVGYWFALGVLYDGGGDDSYTGPWYNQGASAHYAVGALLDLGGNDHYTLTMTQGQGHGRDYSIGLLHDVGGNDVFSGADSALGNANANGIGLFWKQDGAAEFRCRSGMPGSCGDSRPEDLCLGIFAAENGKFIFPDDQTVKTGSRWTRPPKTGQPLSHGLGTVSTD